MYPAAAPIVYGIPILALVGAVVAVLAVYGLSKAMDVSSWETVGRLLQPPGALGRAGLPLLLPIAVLCFFASALLGATLQVAAGVALAALVWLLVLGSATDLKYEQANVKKFVDAWRPSTPYPRELVPPALVGLTAFIVFAFAFRPDRWRSAAGWSGLIEVAGLMLLGTAAALRLFGYATKLRRGLVAVAVALLTIRALTWAGVVGGEDFWRKAHLTAAWTGLALVVVIVGAFAYECWRLGGKKPLPPATTHTYGRAFGLLSALGSTLLLFVALLIASLQTTGGADALGKDDFGDISPTAAPAVAEVGRGADGDLAWTFAPVLHLQHDELYPPVSVDKFLAASTQSGAKAVGSSSDGLALATLPVECPDGGHEPCGTISCPDCDKMTRGEQPEGFKPQGTFYARVARRESEPRAFSGWNPWGKRLDTLIQYWIFYDYDRWQTETVIGALTQEHQGDWEHVSVGLDGNKPLFVALSAHCGGQIVSWDKVVAAPGRVAGGKIVVTPERNSADEDVTHAIVAVAKGSHANYAVSAGHRPPDWGSCKKLPSDALSAMSYASNVRDLTEDGNGGWFAYPADVQVVTDSTPPMSYPGAWGAAEHVTFAHREPTRTGRAPLSPPLQTRSWDKPLSVYFCGKYWRGAIHGTKDECKANPAPKS